MSAWWNFPHPFMRARVHVTVTEKAAGMASLQGRTPGPEKKYSNQALSCRREKRAW